MTGYKLLNQPTRNFGAITTQDLLPGYFVAALSVADVAFTTAYEGQLLVEKVDAAGDNLECVGISTGSTTSGNQATIAQDGLYYMWAGGAIVVGEQVAANDGDPYSVVDCTFTCTGSTALLEFKKPVGTALSSAASGEQVLISLNV